MESIDDLLADVKAEYLEQAQPLELKNQPLLKTEELFAQPPLGLPAQSFSWSNELVSAPEESLISQIRAEFEEEARSAQLQREQQLREEQLKEEQRRQQQREALRSKAEEWLKDVTPDSAEGLWFEEFAYKYPSKLEAAIDYLQALQETNV